MEKLPLAVLLLVLVLPALAFATHSANVSECGEPGCSDSDGGIENATKGTCTLTNLDGSVANKTDFCLNNQTLAEFYCQKGQCLNKTVSCPLGCANGACVNQSASRCVDSDGRDANIRGTTSNGTANFTDSCASSSLDEYYCEDGEIKVARFSCAGGCENGACKTPACCTDSDGGINNATRGTCTQTNLDGTTTNKTDYCANNSTLVEFHCNGGQCLNTTITCPDGCADGKCSSPPRLCSDGTPIGQCSINQGQPFFCDSNATLVSKASVCGCPPGYVPSGDSCIPLATCSDGTPANSCSATKPKYCNSQLQLVDNSSVCGCPAGLVAFNNTCVKCADTDGGRNYAVRGKAYTSNSSKTDYCPNRKKLVEYYCRDSGNIGEDGPRCDSCIKGVCVNPRGGINSGSVPPSLMEQFSNALSDFLDLILSLLGRSQE